MAELARVLNEARQDLLDPTARHRLLAAPRGAAGELVEITGERSEAVFEMLVRRRRRVTLRASDNGVAMPREADGSSRPRPGPWDEIPSGGLPEPEVWLPVALPSAQLERRLLALAGQTDSVGDDHGVHLLYLAFGFLTWSETAGSASPGHAPLLLVPVRLQRAGPHARFELAFAEQEEIRSNGCLSEKLARDFGIELPALPEPDQLQAAAWLAEVAAAVAEEPRCQLQADALALGVFPFDRLLIWRDLDPRAWPEDAPIGRHRLLRRLLVDGFGGAGDRPGEDVDPERLPAAQDAVHVLDADRSQTLAIEAVRRGDDLLIRGAPGTGKSQTIVNLIAGAVHAGKTVLFVAGNASALEVVRRRLGSLDLEGLVLDLHGRHRQRRHLLEELRRTRALGRPAGVDPAPVAAELDRVRDVLDRLAATLHRPLEPSGLTPHELIGRLARLGPVETKGIALEVDQLGPAEIERWRDLAAALGAAVERTGQPSDQPWRGVGCPPLPPSDQRRMVACAGELGVALTALRDVVRRLAAELGEERYEAATLNGLERVLDTSELLSLAPDGTDGDALLDPVWATQRKEIRELVAAGQARQMLRAELEAALRPAALGRDVRALAARYIRLSGRRSRLVTPGWWLARWRVGRLFRPGPPPSLAERLERVQRLARLQAAERHLEAWAALGQSAFGSAWRGLESDFALLAAIEHWERDGRQPHLLEHAAQRLALISRPERHAALAVQAQRLLVTARRELAGLIDDLQLDLDQAFGHGELGDLPLGRLEARLRTFADSGESLNDWLTLQHEIGRATEAGLGPLVEALASGVVRGRDAAPVVQAVVLERLLQKAATAAPELGRFDSARATAALERFRALDRERIELARAEVAVAHALRISSARASDQLPILEQELRATPGDRPIRELMVRAGGAIQAIKPVFMMSPHAVVRLLSPGAVSFDLLVIDEASQVEAAHALGAIARARQLVVVGDERQLRPPPLFADAARAEGAGAAEPRSILELCALRGIRQIRLERHYRSRHPALFSVPNQAFYDGRLMVPPSPLRGAADCGLVLHHLPDAIYERHGSRTNPAEAAWIARAVLHHARTRPDRSLGVGCLSAEQRDRILLELERLRPAAPELEPFFAGGRTEPFFVKSVLGLQGEERDTMMISLSYGRDPGGHLAPDFGPLDAEGAELRLNVLITRARQRLEVVASVRAGEIDPAGSGGPGIQALKTFLRFAERGELDPPARRAPVPASAVTADIAAALRAAGFEVVAPVGDAGFAIDLAVVDPGRPERYLMGIECDGPAWHADPFARDRDRLRQEVLASRGWIVERVWSGAWLEHPEATLERIFKAIEAARATWQTRDEAASRQGPAEPPTPSRSGRPAGGGGLGPRPLAVPYVEAEFTLEPPLEPHLMSAERLRDALVRIVELEGPIHRDEIARRLTRLAGLSRTGRRIAQVVAVGLRRAVAAGRLNASGPFYRVPGSKVVVRDRSAVASAALRRPAMLPPAEIEQAILELVRARSGLAADDVVIRAGRMLGFQSTSAPLRKVIEAARDRLIEDGRLDPNERGLLRERRPAA